MRGEFGTKAPGLCFFHLLIVLVFLLDTLWWNGMEAPREGPGTWCHGVRSEFGDGLIFEGLTIDDITNVLQFGLPSFDEA